MAEYSGQCVKWVPFSTGSTDEQMLSPVCSQRFERGNLMSQIELGFATTQWTQIYGALVYRGEYSAARAQE